MPDSPSTAVVLVEDDARLRDALGLILDGTPGIVTTGAFDRVEAALEADVSRVDVVLLDIDLPGMSGIEGIPKLRDKWSRAEILMQTVYQDDDRVFEALCAGATGYLLKNTPPTEIIDAIREVKDGGAPMTATIARKVVHLFRRPSPEQELTEREEEVLSEIIKGKTNRQIAEDLYISANTVAYHVKQIYEKLHVHSRAEAVAKAMKQRPFRDI